MKRLPVDVSSFKTMIEDGYLYVDKTEIIYHLITKRRLYFLSRPRRFGKSLLISTLRELFSGNKKLFEKTWIATSQYQWIEYPVLHLDFSSMDNETATEFKMSLARKLDKLSMQYGIDIRKDKSPGSKIQTIVESLAQKNKVVILIDEYDYPLLAHITEPTKAQGIQKVIRDFFSVIKGLDEYIHAIFITGVTKFSKTSIFSGMNNLNDITMSPEAALLLGYTEQEIKQNFKEYTELLLAKKNFSQVKFFEQLQAWYDGYRFSESEKKVYNPYSVLHCYDQQKFNNFWFETGTPSFLVTLIKDQFSYLEDITHVEVSAQSLGTFDIYELPLIPILFQTGYLTIHEYDKVHNTYKLAYPNKEVSDSFKKYLLRSLVSKPEHYIENILDKFKVSLEEQDIDAFCKNLTSLLATIPYQLYIQKEAYFHTIFHILVDLLGFKGQSEVSSSKGRLDMVLDTPKAIIIFEFKFKSTGQKALKQIIEQRYYEKYLRSDKPIIAVGLSFNMKQKELLLDWAQQDIVI